jgi:hypothetical protein
MGSLVKQTSRGTTAFAMDAEARRRGEAGGESVA